jgi:nucleoside-diphosphate-sugar epimerase
MRVAVTGATGNVGTSLVSALAAAPEVSSIVGIARRRPSLALPKVEWVAENVCGGAMNLARHFDGADAVVHLAWLIQPSHDRETLRRANVGGSEHVFDAVAAAGVPALVYASSVGAYSPGPKDRPVDESWPTDGLSTSAYATDKAAVERLLDRFEHRHPEIRVVRLRPGLIFKRQAATEIRRLFLGPFVPRFLLNPRLLPMVPKMPRLRFQAVHADDVADAYRRAVLGDVRGAFNVASEPVLDSERLAETLDARPVPVPPGLLRGLVSASWRLRLQPTSPGWLDMGLGVPLMDIRRAREELGWSATRTSTETLAELLEGMRRGDGAPTPPLDPGSSGPLRSNELRTRVGGRSL